MDFSIAERLSSLPAYPFAEIARAKARAIQEGRDIIDLGIGDPDLPTYENIIGAMELAARAPENHRYPSYTGMVEFRTAVAGWYRRRFGVDLDPDREVLTLIGSKEGIAHLPLAFVDPGRTVLVPDPGYPVYRIGTLFAGGRPHTMPLLERSDFLPDLDAIPPDVAREADIMFLNYPNNPTSAVADLSFFNSAVAFAREHRIILCHDAAYTEIAFDGFRPPSLLQAEGAMEVGVEFHSLSKTYNMTGWRVGFCVGNAKVIRGLGMIKTNVDSGVFGAIQRAGIEALEGDQSGVESSIDVYRDRRDVLVRGLTEAGLRVHPCRATFYLWTEVPDSFTSASFVKHLLERADVAAVPGTAFGEFGEGYIRFALTAGSERIREAAERIRTSGI